MPKSEFSLLVIGQESKAPVKGARVTTSHSKDAAAVHHGVTDEAGACSHELDYPANEYVIEVECFGVNHRIPVTGHDTPFVCEFPLGHIKVMTTKDCQSKECHALVANTPYVLDLERPAAMTNEHLSRIEWSVAGPATVSALDRFTANVTAFEPGEIKLISRAYGAKENESHEFSITKTFSASPAVAAAKVSLQRAAIRPTFQEGLWTMIRANRDAIGFQRYREFINRVLCHKNNGKGPLQEVEGLRRLRERGEELASFGVGAYELLRTATEMFLLVNCRVNSIHGTFEDFRSNSPTGPHRADLHALAQEYLGHNQYIGHVIDAAFHEDHLGPIFCDRVLFRKDPCLIELIWSYWHEEAMLTQSIQAITRRFQNHHARGARDPLANFELDPLRPMNNILWGYVQEEYKRLTVPRRALEYSHEYGLTLFGKANPGSRSADPRSKFIESFHNLLYRCFQFFKEDSDTTVIADGFPLLNALREVHLVLAQGAHNQFGDLPWTARVEMLIEQWIMARGEIRDFMQSRAMVPYREAWMPQVDSMKTLQGWTDVSVSHFHDLGTYGEDILLSIRYGDWVNINDEDVAKNWARYWRPEIQSYLHAYRAAVGVDLTSSDAVDATIPGIHLQRRLEVQARVR
jgi:hypothetical protein